TVLFLLPSPVSIAHACLAQTFFCLTITLAVVTGSRWKQAPPRTPDVRALAAMRLGIITTAAVFVQLILGAAFRHNALGIAPHLIGAAVVVFLVAQGLYRLGRGSVQPRLRRATVSLAVVLGAQLLLGASAYLARVITRDAPQPLPVMVWATVAHVVTGALTLAAALKLTLEAHRGIVWPASERWPGKLGLARRFELTST